MRLAWQPALALVLTTVGVLLLGLAVLDWSAYDFAALETSLHEWRVYGRIAGDYFSDPWSPFEWWDVVGSARHGLMMACLALVGGLAALAAAWLVRRRRAARALLALALACAAAIAGVAASEMMSARAVNLAVTTLERPAGPRLRWLWPEFERQVPIAHLDVGFAAAILLLLLVAVISFAGVRIAGRAPAVLCAGLLATLTATLALVHRIRQFDAFTYPLEGWADFLHTSRLVLVGAAVVGLVGLLPAAVRRGPANLPLAVALLAAGLAAFIASEPHRRTADSFYPQRDPGRFSLDFHWLPHPETFEPSRIDVCAPLDDPPPWQQAAVRLDDTGAVVLDMEGMRRPLLPGDTIAALATPSEGRAHYDGWYKIRHPDELTLPRELVLLIDRRVPASALAELLRRLPDVIDRVTAAGAFAQVLPSAYGPIETWTLCNWRLIDRFAVIDGLTEGKTWGEIIDGA